MPKTSPFRLSLMFLLLILLLTTAVFAAPDSQAEPVEPTAQQQTLEASVNDLFRQTAEAQQPDYTQTVQALFESALTATADAPTPAAEITPQPVDVSGLEVVETTEIDLFAGPGRTSAYLAPNGEYFAWFGPVDNDAGICIYTIAGENTGCVPFSENYDSSSVRWSPDSTKLVFAQDFLRMFIDSDIWMFDVETLSVTNITDDGLEDTNFLTGKEDDPASPPIDLVPMWGADSQSVYFLRYLVDDEADRNRPDLYRLDLAMGEMEIVHSFVTLSPFGIYRGDISPDGHWLAYTVDTQDRKTMNVRLLDLETNEDRLLTPFAVSDERPFQIDYLQFSADSLYVLTRDPVLLSRGMPLQPEDPVSRVFDLDGNEFLIDPERSVIGAGWLATGASLVYQVMDADDPGEGAMYVTGEPGEPGRLLLAGRYLPPTTRQEQILSGSNNTLLMTARGGSPLIVLRLASE